MAGEWHFGRNAQGGIVYRAGLKTMRVGESMVHGRITAVQALCAATSHLCQSDIVILRPDVPL